MGCAIKRLMAITVLLFGACSRKNAKPPLFHVTPLYEACSERITTADVGKDFRATLGGNDTLIVSDVPNWGAVTHDIEFASAK